MQVGRITFGPQLSPEERIRQDRHRQQMWASTQKLTLEDRLNQPRACNCIGPQPGETKCPCRLRAESNQGRHMVRDGVVIDGVEYDLVPKRQAKSVA